VMRERVAGFDTRTDSLEVRRRTGHLPGELKLSERSTVFRFLSCLGRVRGRVDRHVIDELGTSPAWISPDRVDDQLQWLRDARFEAHASWTSD
jgi:hypothetical protein